MHQFLQVVGAIIVLATLGLLVFMVGRSNGDILVLLGMLPTVIPAIVGGVLIAAFGAMLENLLRVREEAEQHTVYLKIISDTLRLQSAK